LYNIIGNNDKFVKTEKRKNRKTDKEKNRKTDEKNNIFFQYGRKLKNLK